jgi:hypothetical protein
MAQFRPMGGLLQFVVQLVARIAGSGVGPFKHAAGLVAQHTGVPVLLVAAGMLVASYRLVKSAARAAAQVALVAGALLLATHLGWLRW